MANNSQRISPQDQWLFDGEDNLVGVKNPNVHGQDMLPLLYSVDPVTNVVTADITVTTLTTTGNALIGDAATDTIAVQAGSAALPSIIKTGDTNTGIWFPAADTVAVSTAGVERMRIDSAGSVGIGATSASISLRVAKSITGGTIAYGIVANGQVQTDVTVGSYGFASLPSFANFAASLHKHFDAAQGTVSGSLTNQYGFTADSSLVGATNNYGFYSNIASAANRYNFYASGTAPNYFAGVTGIGVAAAATSNLTVAASTTAVSSLNIPHGAAPTSPVNGDMWTTTAGLFIRINGATVGPLS